VKRYAVYYAPPAGSALDRFGRQWLGRDASTGVAVVPPAVDGITSSRLSELTAEPRRYGFHGTLKPPFALADGMTADELRAALHRFARRRGRVAAGPLRLAEIGRFLALVPADACLPLHELAADVVEAFDRFRRSPDEEELSRRRAAGLTVRQDANLVAWGYPYVMEDFRFHLTLTGPLADGEEKEILKRHLSAQASCSSDVPLVIEDLVLFTQTRHDEPFEIVERARLAGP
jgi:putative phosphonate metabolism protein